MVNCKSLNSPGVKEAGADSEPLEAESPLVGSGNKAISVRSRYKIQHLKGQAPALKAKWNKQIAGN